MGVAWGRVVPSEPGERSLLHELQSDDASPVLRVISSAANLSAQAVGKQRMKAKRAEEDNR
jgi:alkylated DNA nucleotide flippase Atl1